MSIGFKSSWRLQSRRKLVFLHNLNHRPQMLTNKFVQIDCVSLGFQMAFSYQPVDLFCKLKQSFCHLTTIEVLCIRLRVVPARYATPPIVKSNEYLEYAFFAANLRFNALRLYV
jgi:hypothetical protein